MQVSIGDNPRRLAIEIPSCDIEHGKPWFELNRWHGGILPSPNPAIRGDTVPRYSYASVHCNRRPKQSRRSTVDKFAEPVKQHLFELHFKSLFNGGRGYAFPCDAHGRVDMDALSSRCVKNYLYARATVGREFAAPSVQPSSS
jgi:hypothetical protein